MNQVRHRSPVAPSLSLQAALAKATQIAQVGGEKAMTRECAVRAMGYRHASQGAAGQGLATLIMFGLLEVKGPGRVALSPAFYRWRSASDAQERHACLLQCLKTPEVFARLLAAYSGGLPSDATLLHKLVVELGFGETRARKIIRSLRQSLAFVEEVMSEVEQTSAREPEDQVNPGHDLGTGVSPAPLGEPLRAPPQDAPELEPYDAPIPVRLSGGRKAWLRLPRPFYESDKAILRAQIDIILADDDALDATGPS